ncbi:MAG: helix-turn-helix domain-containing protein [Anaerolineae bacterium]|jgi:transcriptional regulator with XRE-family HTH domain
MSEWDAPDVGQHVRAMRHERGLSLRALAELCELSPNTISLIERGETSPSVSTLQRLATALGVHINSFFVDTSEKVKLILTRADERTRSGSASVMLESLGYGLEGQSCDPFMVTLKPKAGSGPHMMAHTGSELIHCLIGSVEIEVAGTDYLLEPGDTLLFRAEQTHRWRNPGRRPATFLLMMQAVEDRDDSVDQHLHP